MKRFGIDLVIKIPNLVVGKLRSSAWNLLRELVGEKALMALLLMQGKDDGALFMQVLNENEDSKNAGKCYTQLAGDLLCERMKLCSDAAQPPSDGKPNKSSKRQRDWDPPLAESTPPLKKKRKLQKANQNVKKSEDNIVTTTLQKNTKNSILRKPGSITFYRMRMFYAKPVLNKDGEVKFGLRHIRKHLIHRFSLSNFYMLIYAVVNILTEFYKYFSYRCTE